jgi:hypothetical protein
MTIVILIGSIIVYFCATRWIRTYWMRWAFFAALLLGLSCIHFQTGAIFFFVLLIGEPARLRYRASRSLGAVVFEKLRQK